MDLAKNKLMAIKYSILDESLARIGGYIRHYPPGGALRFLLKDPLSWADLFHFSSSKGHRYYVVTFSTIFLHFCLSVTNCFHSTTSAASMSFSISSCHLALGFCLHLLLLLPTSHSVNLTAASAFILYMCANRRILIVTAISSPSSSFKISTFVLLLYLFIFAYFYWT